MNSKVTVVTRNVPIPRNILDGMRTAQCMRAEMNSKVTVVTRNVPIPRNILGGMTTAQCMSKVRC